jgi:hypothetical protein
MVATTLEIATSKLPVKEYWALPCSTYSSKRFILYITYYLRIMSDWLKFSVLKQN